MKNLKDHRQCNDLNFKTNLSFFNVGANNIIQKNLKSSYIIQLVWIKKIKHHIEKFLMGQKTKYPIEEVPMVGQQARH